MNSIISRLRSLFGTKTEKLTSEKKQSLGIDMTPPADQVTHPKAESPSETSDQNAENFFEQPQKRMVIQPSIISNENSSSETGKTFIKAQPSETMDQCKFMVNQNLLPSQSWYFSSFESAAGSPLAEALFSVEGIETVLVHDSTVTVTRTDETSADWKPIAGEIGKVIREKVQSSETLISEEIRQSIPSEPEVRNKIQEVIDLEVNPGVAGHGGRITLTKVEGNTVTIQMGGGCQGCSAADLTLKQGIHSAFRKALPTVGAIYDETDHKSGLNPYYS